MQSMAISIIRKPEDNPRPIGSRQVSQIGSIFYAPNTELRQPLPRLPSALSLHHLVGKRCEVEERKPENKRKNPSALGNDSLPLTRASAAPALWLLLLGP